MKENKERNNDLITVFQDHGFDCNNGSQPPNNTKKWITAAISSDRTKYQCLIDDVKSEIIITKVKSDEENKPAYAAKRLIDNDNIKNLAVDRSIITVYQAATAYMIGVEESYHQRQVSDPN